MQQFVTRQDQRGAVAMTQALVIGAAEAAVLTPIHTSFLLNSQFRNVRKEGDRIIGTVGYMADYALPVHDPAHPQVFRRPSAEKEFLTKGMRRGEPQMRAVIVGGLKV